MTSVRLLRVIGAAAAFLAFHVMAIAQSGDPLAAIQSQLTSGFKLTRIAADRSDIVTAGDVVQIHKPGLVMYAVASPMPPANSYKNGKIGQGWGGFGKDVMIGMVTPGSGTAADYPHRTFAVDEKCWVTAVQVQKDGVLFQLYSDPYDDVRYYANLKIPFPDKKNVPTADAAKQLIADVLTVVPEDGQVGGQEGQTASNAVPSPASNGSGPQAVISGKYLSEKNGAELNFVSNDSVVLQVPGADENHGQYSVSGAALQIKFPNDRRPINFKIQGDKLISDKGTVWDRQGGAPGTGAETADPGAAQGDQQAGLAGEYTARSGSRIVLQSDGTFIKFVGAGQGKGRYQASAGGLQLTFDSTGSVQSFQIQGGNLVDLNTHSVWARTGDAPASTESAAPAVQTPLPAIAPPPPPADAPPPTISVGQTREQVTTAFGQPLKAAKIGAKDIFYYKDMKVTFLNGKVTNVE